MLSCGYDKTARLFDMKTGKEIKVFPHRNYVTCVQFHPSDPTLFLAGTFKSSILCLVGQEDWKLFSRLLDAGLCFVALSLVQWILRQHPHYRHE
nr:uncharacterized protein LOC131790215 [Pocillopora verrucosa]